MFIAGDLGGTKTILQLVERRDGGSRVVFEGRYLDAGFDGFDALFTRFLDDVRTQGLERQPIEVAVLGVAGPIDGDRVRMTNLPWVIDGVALAAKFGIGRVRLVNDFVAAASGIALLDPADVIALQPGEPVARAPQVVLGAGTGLGVAFRVWQAGRYEVLESEGGNAGFAPATPEQCELWRHIHAKTGWVAVEQVVSGPGLVNVYEFLSARGAQSGSQPAAPLRDGADKAAAVVELALKAGDPLAGRALDLFIEAYGAAAGDFALDVLARGGVYIAGGIAPRIVSRLRLGGFLKGFRSKGRFGERLARIPVHVVTNAALGVLGARAIAVA